MGRNGLRSEQRNVRNALPRSMSRYAQFVSTLTMGTLGRFMVVQDNFHFNFVCRWLFVYTRSKTAITKIILSDIMFSKNETDLVKKMLRGPHFMGLKSFYALCAIWSRMDEKTQCDYG